METDAKPRKPRVSNSDIRKAIYVLLLRIGGSDETWRDRLRKDVILTSRGRPKKDPIKLEWRESETPIITANERFMVECYVEVFLDILRYRIQEFFPGKEPRKQLRGLFQKYLEEHSKKLNIEWIDP